MPRWRSSSRRAPLDAFTLGFELAPFCVLGSAVRCGQELWIRRQFLLERGLRRQRDQQRGRVDELRATLEEVDRLRGILPICSVCKKARDDSGYGHQVELTRSERSSLRFSHGISQDGTARFHPELTGGPTPPAEGSTDDR